MKKHRFNIFPEMQSDDYNRLKSDLATNGYDSKNPIYLYQGEILDGWNRQMACDELGITPVTTCFTGSDFDAINFVMRTNKRRNLNSSQWAAIAVEAEEMVQAIREKVEKEKAEKFIGNDNAAKDKTVRQLIDRPFSEPFVNKLSQGTNAHNSPYVAPSVRGDDEPIVNQKGVVIKPIVRADSILATTFNTNRTYINEAGKLRDNNPEAFEQVKRGEKTIPEVRKEIKRAEQISQFEKQVADAENEFKESDFLNVCNIVHASIVDFLPTVCPDVIITDPPYPREYLPLYETLAKLSKNVPVVAVMCGQSYLPEIYSMMSKHLKYRWTLAYLTPGGQAVQQWTAKVNTFWKPILLFGESVNWFGDVAKSNVNDNDKNHHGWGQSESGMADLVERLTTPGQLVCDPFCGAGTTGVVSLALKRKFTGCDIDISCVNKSIDRHR